MGGALGALTLASPAVATYDTFCGGKGQTPTIHIVVNGDYEILKAEFSQHGRPILADQALTWSRRSTYSFVEIRVYRRSGAQSARLIIRPETGADTWVGTFVVNRRKYWISCGGFG